MASSRLDIGLLKKVLALAKPYRKMFALAILFSIGAAILAPILPYLVNLTLDGLLLQSDFSQIQNYCLAMLVVLVLQTIFMLLNTYTSSWLGQSVILDLRNKVYHFTLKQKLAFFDVTPIGTLITRNVSDIETITQFFSQGIITILGDLLQVITIITVMFYINWKLALVVMILFPFLVIASRIFGKKVKKSFEQVRNQVSRLNTIVQEYIAGINVVQLYDVEDKAYERFNEANLAHYKANEKSVLYYSIFFPVIEIITAVTIGLLFVAATAGTQAQFLFSAGEITAFIMLVNQFYRPIRTIADRFNTIQMGLVSANRVFALIEDESYQEKETGEGSVAVENYNITFNDVHFAYNEDTPVLQGINLHVNQGETLAIVGETGAGKSTIINLISKLYPQFTGEITIGNQNINSFKLNELRKIVAVVLQDVFIFSGTLRENMDPANEYTDDEVVQAIENLGLEDILLGKGLDYKVGERGSGLSLGEKQLVSFVRATLVNPPILILDEATSSIDPATEQIIQKTIPKLTKNRTSIVIAHRLSTIANADEIVLIAKGKVSERGTHEELLSKEGAYFKLHESGSGVER